MTLRGRSRGVVRAGPDVVRVADRVTGENHGSGPTGPGVQGTSITVEPSSAASGPSSSSYLDHKDHPDQTLGEKGNSGPGTRTENDGTRTTETAYGGSGAECSTPPRVVGRPFPKGTSGNPGGIPRDVIPLVQEARRLALSYAPQAIETLAGLLGDKDPRVRVSAAEGLLDRAGVRAVALDVQDAPGAASGSVFVVQLALPAREVPPSYLVEGRTVRPLPSPGQPGRQPEPVLDTDSQTGLGKEVDPIRCEGDRPAPAAASRGTP